MASGFIALGILSIHAETLLSHASTERCPHLAGEFSTLPADL